jgi:hypothetical protein
MEKFELLRLWRRFSTVLAVPFMPDVVHVKKRLRLCEMEGMLRCLGIGVVSDS